MTKQEEFVLLVEQSKTIYDSLREKLEHPSDLFFHINSIEELVPKMDNFRGISFTQYQWHLILLIMERLYNDGNIDYNNIATEKTEIFAGGFVELNEKHSNYWIEDISYFFFSNFYPSMINNIMEYDKELIFSIKNFNQIFDLVFHRYNSLKEIESTQHSLQYKEEYQLYYEVNNYLKMWINMTFGILSSNKYLLNCNKNIAEITSRKCAHLMKFLYHEFTDHIVYTDTDEIYFIRYAEIEKRFRAILEMKKYNFLMPRFSHNKSGIFIAKKKFILQNRETHELKIRGIRKK
jgi:hypothetical protein